MRAEYKLNGRWNIIDNEEEMDSTKKAAELGGIYSEILQQLEHKEWHHIMYTLTKDRCELRVWDALPSSFGDDHVDAGGQGLLMHIWCNDRSFVQKVLDELQKVKTLEEVILSNGTMIFIRM
jgi:hypothetical protein